MFHDGAPVDAAAVKANLERARTLPDSNRKSELATVASVEAPDAETVVLRLSEPDASLLSQLSDRAGMMMSPAAFDKDPGGKPVCSGPYQFRSGCRTTASCSRNSPSIGTRPATTSTAWSSSRFPTTRCA